jgi:UDP-N-acetylmuramoylalanine--D-glutamate ligase
MNMPTVWIVGGVDKGNDYNELMSLVREKVKAIVCLGVDNKKIIDVFGNVVDVVLEVTNMDDAVRMAQRLTEKEILFYYHLPVLVLICLKIMRMRESI